MKQWFLTHRYGLTVALVAAMILLPFLGAAPLMDPDEPVYGETAREMLLAGDWLSPRIFGQYWYDKPPLFYWLEMLSYSFFGVSDIASRLPSVIMAMATTMYVYVQGKELFNKPIAFLSALFLVTSAGFVPVGFAPGGASEVLSSPNAQANSPTAVLLPPNAYELAPIAVL